MKRTIRNCEAGLKFHRGCCHGYKDKDDFESFVSPVGKVQMDVIEKLGKDENDVAPVGSYGQDNNSQDSTTVHDTKSFAKAVQETKPSGVITVDCNPENFHRCLQNRSLLMQDRKRDAVVVSINAGVGNVTVALKQLNLSMKTVIHVEEDRVAQHVYRSNHDFSYGVTDYNDCINHVTGLYESLNDLRDNPEELVLKYGPIGK